jgi:hypothetical protein
MSIFNSCDSQVNKFVEGQEFEGVLFAGLHFGAALFSEPELFGGSEMPVD